jgi:hypothetical protein
MESAELQHDLQTEISALAKTPLPKAEAYERCNHLVLHAIMKGDLPSLLVAERELQLVISSRWPSAKHSAEFGYVKALQDSVKRAISELDTMPPLRYRILSYLGQVDSAPISLIMDNLRGAATWEEVGTEILRMRAADPQLVYKSVHGPDCWGITYDGRQALAELVSVRAD